MIKIKFLLKLFLSSLSVFFVCLLTLGSVHASSDLVTGETISENRIEVTVTNNETGEIIILDSSELEVEEIKKTNFFNFNSYLFDEKEKNIDYEIFVPFEAIENEDHFNIVPFASQGGSKTSGGVTAKLNVNYLSNSKGEIKVEKVYGSWAPSSNLYRVGDRSVNAHNGGNQFMKTARKLSKTPGSNSFSYSVDWPYHGNVIGGTFGARAWSSAVITVPGMGGSHTISVDFTFN